jgi:adenylosuccinate lyase
VRNSYENPLTERWAPKEMSGLFSPDRKFRTWRALWIALAEGEKELGLPITGKQIAQMRKFRDRINYAAAEAREKETFHDVMSHVWAYGLQCPAAKPIIHLGATSAYVGDNTDLIVMRDALELVAGRIAAVVAALADFARDYRDLPTLAFTHFQPAQLTTVGKRATLWIQDLLFDLDNIERLAREMPFLGVKGTTGTQASFLALFSGNHRKVEALDRLVAKKMGFTRIVEVSGQTYPRKIDYFVLAALSGVAQSASKFATDLRLLAHLQEVEEPFGKKQIGSSAMAYKRNPMQSERVVSLARNVMSLAANAAHTAANQWFERTLDDSANRRITIPEAFLAIDVILSTYHYVAAGLVVNPDVIASHVARELPFMATENILMAAVKAGGDRQELHELIRRASREAAASVKKGGENDLLDRLSAMPEFAKVARSFRRLLDPRNFTGRSAAQVDSYLKRAVKPALARRRPAPPVSPPGV